MGLFLVLYKEHMGKAPDGIPGVHHGGNHTVVSFIIP